MNKFEILSCYFKLVIYRRDYSKIRKKIEQMVQKVTSYLSKADPGGDRKKKSAPLLLFSFLSRSEFERS